MAQLTLKSILNKRSEITGMLQALVSETNMVISIVDHEGLVVFGQAEVKGHSRHSIYLNEDIVGQVIGPESGIMVANLLSMMLRKESEKKKLGTEVLNLYQELNVIYNFSEKLAQTIDPDIIAHFTLEQAMHSIPSESGVIVLWDEVTKTLLIPAKTGDPLFDELQLKENTALLLRIGMGGQSEIMSDIDQLKSSGIIKSEVQSIIYAAMKVKHRIMGAIILGGKTADQYSAAHLKLLVTLALQSSTAIESAMLFEKNIREVREREEDMLRIHEVTKKFVPHEFIRALGKNSLLDVRLGDQVEKIVTVLFIDIREFTTLSEKMTPQENFRFVSSFNERLGPIIRSHQGFINQYLGDSIMALFPIDPEDALKAAIKMQHAISELNKDRALLGLLEIKAGIGLHTGSLIMGITGDEDRLDAATISDTVNTAARIESLTKYFRSPILLSGDTLSLIKNRDQYHLRQLGKAQLKGKHNLLHIVECINGYASDELNLKLNTLGLFNEAMHHYFNQNFIKAIELFQTIIELDPEDQTVENFITYSSNYFNTGVPTNWTGAMEITIK